MDQYFKEKNISISPCQLSTPSALRSQEEGVTRNDEAIDSKSKNKFLELKEELESGFEIDLKTIDNLDVSGSSLLRENSLENDDIENIENIESEEDFPNKTSEIIDIHEKTHSLNNTATHSKEETHIE